ncbi:dynein light chain Tctex-type 1-like isoform X2 [Narcine bancroftii]|uniref:dynein light chain Tctex-type 1-like isoform X2 n=1 Tax=Narcine bancroftii TaxID=1343680 RepID=UPI003831A65E
MDEYQSGEETTFIVDESIETAIGGNAYQPSRVNQWTTSVVELCLSQLTKLGKPFKYIVTSVIMQKNGAGLHTASSCYWDNNADGIQLAPLLPPVPRLLSWSLCVTWSESLCSTKSIEDFTKT